MKKLFNVFSKIFEKNKEPEHHAIELGCAYCSQFNGRGCKLTGKTFPSYMNIMVKPLNCPVIDQKDNN